VITKLKNGITVIPPNPIHVQHCELSWSVLGVA